jgi:hypothetical protein
MRPDRFLLIRRNHFCFFQLTRIVQGIFHRSTTTQITTHPSREGFPLLPNQGKIQNTQQNLFDKDLYVLAVFFVGYIDDLAGHAGAQGIHYIGHIYALHFGREMSADLHASVHQRQRDLH